MSIEKETIKFLIKIDRMIEFNNILIKIKMTVKEFSEHYEIPYNTVRQWVNGTRKPPAYVLKLLNEKIEHETKGEQLKIEEKKTLIELPCKVGDTIWCIEGFCDDSYDIIEKVVGYLVVFANSIDIHASKPNTLGITRAYDTGKIGKTVFLTREEAEKHLKECTQ